MTRFPSGPRLRQARLSAGMTVEESALAIGRTAYSINSYELGRVAPPIQTLALLAELYGVTIGGILGEQAVA